MVTMPRRVPFTAYRCKTNLPGYQGASDYAVPGSKPVASRDGRLRVAFWAAYRVVENSSNDDSSSSRTLVVPQWIDVCGWVPEFLFNSAHHVAYQGLVERLHKQFPPPPSSLQEG